MTTFIIQSVLKTDETDKKKALKKVRNLLKKEFHISALVISCFDVEKHRENKGK